jgi:hypothetical protein
MSFAVSVVRLRLGSLVHNKSFITAFYTAIYILLNKEHVYKSSYLDELYSKSVVNKAA